MPAPALLENKIFTPHTIAAWCFFTAAAGFVNATALLAGDNVVSHVTGSVTAFATKPSVAIEIGIIVIAFLAGGILAALAKEKMTSWKGYVVPPAVAAVVLVAMGALGRFGFFGDFGGDKDVTGHAFPMLTMLSFAMGMLNASVGLATANRIRVTHLTGPLTDLAGHIARGETKWIALRGGTFLAFVGGAALAAKIGPRFEYDTFVAGAALISIAIGLTSHPAHQEEEDREPLRASLAPKPAGH
jgi:uncharacterized membrane protein YoaK (UPF0700 family)